MYSLLFTRLARDYQLELEREAESRNERKVYRPIIQDEETGLERMRRLVEAAENIFAPQSIESDACQFCCEGGD